MALAVAGAPSGLNGALEPSGALTSTLSCSPPRTHTRISNYTTRLTAPTVALAAAKTRRRCRRQGGGGDDEVPDGDDGSGDGGFGGGDDFHGNWGWGSDDGSDGGNGSQRSVLQDLALLWGIFCAACLVQTLQHMVRRGTREPSAIIAALTLAHLRPSRQVPSSPA
ncbi:hypothetical protein N2152v2_009057 [Parachlorella kessleri]